MKKMTLSERIDSFWNRVDKSCGPDSCWIWKGCKNKKGYGHLMWENRKLILAHRASFQLCIGNVPSGKLIMHSCNNPSCVNPSHLSLGTNKQNMQDASKIGRLRKGHFLTSKLGDHNAWIVKFGLSMGLSIGELSKHFVVSRETIYQVISGRCYSHVNFGNREVV